MLQAWDTALAPTACGDLGANKVYSREMALEQEEGSEFRRAVCKRTDHSGQSWTWASGIERMVVVKMCPAQQSN